jgi:hypothetical protein
MADEREDQDIGRAAHFRSGASGDFSGTHAATSIPEVQQASPVFNPASSVLMAANQFSGVTNASSEGTLKVSNPYGLMMAESLKQSGTGTTGQ